MVGADPLDSHGGTGDTEGEAGDCQSQFLISDFFISVTLCLCEILPGRGRSLGSHGGTGDTEGEAGDCQSEFLISDFYISVTLCLCEILPGRGSSLGSHGGTGDTEGEARWLDSGRESFKLFLSLAKPGCNSPQTASPAAAIATMVHVDRSDRSSFGSSSIR